jgi:CBS domain-containing protein
MRCSDVMRRAVTSLSEAESAQSAARLLRDGDADFVGVCDHEGRLVGTVSEHDLVRVVAEDWPASTCPVRDIMSTEVIACRVDEDLEVADQLMDEYERSRVLVVDERDVLQGFISRAERPAGRPEREPPAPS